TTFTVTVVVDPASVAVDAASVALTFDARFLAVDGGGLSPGAALDTELGRAVDNSQGTVYFAAGKMGGPWPDASFTLVGSTFRFVASPAAALSVDLTTSGRQTTAVSAYGANVLNAAHG